MLRPVFFDCNHNNDLDFAQIATWAWGASFKATQGLGFTDPLFRQRREKAESLGLLVSAYDFATGDSVRVNVDRFFSVVNPGPQTGMVLDFEDNEHSEMSGDQALEFLDRVNQRLGRGAIIYGGNRIREHVKSQDKRWIDMAKIVQLWLCQYKSAQVQTIDELNKLIRVPAPWTRWTFLQYAADGAGPQPHKMPGVENKADLNVFDGTREEFARVWPGLPLPPAPAVA